MFKIGLSVLGMLAAVLVVLLVIGGIPKSKWGAGSSSKIQTVGLPEHGIEIVGPMEGAFTRLMSNQLQKTTGLDVAALKSSSVFVVNRSGQSIAALRVKWDLRQVDGRSIVRYREFRGGLQVESDTEPAQLSKEVTPNENRLVSLIDGGEDPSIGFQTRIGGGRRSDVLRDLSESESITISADGVLFVDGTLIGPDTRDFFGSLKAQLEARLEVYEEIARALKGDSEAMRSIEHLAKGDQPSIQMPSGTDHLEVQLEKRQIAGVTLKFRRDRGDKWVLERINAELSKPRITLRKLQSN
jgi:hypothetical protein